MIVVHEQEWGDHSVVWPFDGDSPRWNPPHPDGMYQAGAVLDPFPAYGHDFQTVITETDALENSLEALGWVAPWRVDLWVLARECMSRTNGWSNVAEGDWDDEAQVYKAHRGLIAFSAKRTPIHPAVTRYLVAHEYGHNVQWMLEYYLGLRICGEGLLRHYAEVRGFKGDPDRHGSGGRWHSALSEVFACDFRILVAGVDPLYWPHKGVLPPTMIEGLAAWWDTAVDIQSRDTTGTFQNALLNGRRS